MEQNDFMQESASSSGLAALDQLESKLQNAVERFRDSRQVAAEAKSLLAQKDDEIQRLSREVEELRTERDQVRKRIESLLDQVETLGA